MREILAPAAEALGAGTPVALATVVASAGSAPRELGATMLVLPDARAFGNVSAGCVDGAVHALCTDALAGAGAIVERFGIADEDAYAAGLACGGSMDVLVRAVAPGTADAAALALLAQRDVAGIATSARLHADGRLVIAESTSGGAADDQDGLVIQVGGRSRLIIVGAVEVAVALSALSAAMGFHVTVVDPRDVFANPARFPGAEVVIDQPGRYLAAAALDATAAVCVLTHDPKFDVPALRAALATPAGYIGAMGSRRTAEDRLRRLASAGTPPASVARVRSPIGLDLGGRAPQEIALSILAEIITLRHGGSGSPLSGLAGPVHAPRAPGHALPAAARAAETRSSRETRTLGPESVLVPADVLASGPVCGDAAAAAPAPAAAPAVLTSP